MKKKIPAIPTVRVAIVALLATLVLGVPVVPTGAADTSIIGASRLLQFQASGHVLGFQPTRVYLAGLDHALSVEFLGTEGVTPQSAAASSTGGANPLTRVTYPDLWPGISVTVEAVEDGVAGTTYWVAPGADAGRVQLRYNVPVEVQDDGSLRFSFNGGYVTESAPLAWQEIAGAQVPVQIAFAVAPQTSEVSETSEVSAVGFTVEQYDPRYALVIAPAYAWHTFYGSGGEDTGTGIAVDGSGNIYITGWSNAAWQGDGGANPLHAYSGGRDIVVVKLGSNGAYQWHTFYGSSLNCCDDGYAIAVNGSGDVYVAGSSDASWQGDGGANPLHAYSGGSYEIVVLKLNSSGVYQWHTFYGSSTGGACAGQSHLNLNSSLDAIALGACGYGIALSGNGNVYVAGYSNSTWQGDGNTNPLHEHSGGSDIVAVELNNNGAYQWHTFYGSSAWDIGSDTAIDGSGNVYVVADSDTTWQGDGGANPLHAHSGGHEIVVLKLNSSGAYLWHTFYGSTEWDVGNDIAVDGDGGIYIAAESDANWHGDGGASPRHAHSGWRDIVVLKLNGSGLYQWHTFYGSDTWDAGQNIAIDENRNIYVAAESAGTWQGDGDANPLHAYSGGRDIVILRLNNNGTYRWHTFYGTGINDGGASIAVDGGGNIDLGATSCATWQGDGGAEPLHAYSGGWGDIAVLRLGAVHPCFMPLTLRNYMPPCDPYEPNDDRHTNPWGPLQSAQPYQAKLCLGDVEDNYYLDVTTTAPIQLHLQLPSSLAGHSSIWLYAQSNLSTPICGTGPVGADYTVACPITQTGRYIVRLYAEEGYSDNTNPYTLQVTFQ